RLPHGARPRRTAACLPAPRLPGDRRALGEHRLVSGERRGLLPDRQDDALVLEPLLREEPGPARPVPLPAARQGSEAPPARPRRPISSGVRSSLCVAIAHTCPNGSTTCP